MLSSSEDKTLSSIMNNTFKDIPFFQLNKLYALHVSVIAFRKEAKEILPVVFAGFWEGLSAENLLYQREGMSNQSRVNH